MAVAMVKVRHVRMVVVDRLVAVAAAVGVRARGLVGTVVAVVVGVVGVFVFVVDERIAMGMLVAGAQRHRRRRSARRSPEER